MPGDEKAIKKFCWKAGRPRRSWGNYVKIALREWGGRMYTGFVWFRIEIVGVLLWSQL